MNDIITYLTGLLLLCYVILLLKEELHMMQLNSYFNTRYFKWLKETFISRYNLIKVLIILAGCLFCFSDFTPIAILTIMCSVWGIISLAKQKQKKNLDFTHRAIRLFTMEIVLLMVAIVFITFLFTQNIQYLILFFTLVVAFSFIIVIFANILTKPIENIINQWYINDAKKKINAYSNLITIAITGSFGKTSVKYFLHSILSEKYNVLITPGSFNTTLGVVRIIRENLRPTHEIFIAEMGAKRIGDVHEICEIVKPNYSIITAIGPQHLETFGSIANIKKAKFEVVSYLPVDGTGYVNFDDINRSDFPDNVKAKIVSFAVRTNADYMAKNICYKGLGMSFDVYNRNEKIMAIETMLLGEHNVSNLLACCAIALDFGIEKYKIEKAIKSISAVSHRLEVKKLLNGITIIDDAFNSNPVGSKMALEVLKRFEGKRKIVITPGMIELGEKEYELNYEFGKIIAQNSDIAVLVGISRTLPIQEGIKSTNFPIEKMFICKDLTEANEKVKSIMKEGDIVLYENDLPDTFNE